MSRDPSARPRLVASELLPASARLRLDEAGTLTYREDLFADLPALREALAEADALVVRNQTRVDEALLRAAPRLRVVGRVGVGLDNLDRAALAARGVRVTWAPGTNAVSVAEYVLGALLALYRRFETVSAELHRGRWDRRAATGSEAYGRVLGVVGLGDIGARVVRRARAFGMEVVATDPVRFGSSFAVQEYGVPLLPLDALLARADAVTLHVPLTPATRHLIGAAELGRMRPGAVLVNTSRGGLVDEAALADALRGGHLGGAALDVRAQEPPGEDDPLRGLPNVLLTPHIAGVTEASLQRAASHVVEDVLRVLGGGEPVSPAPPPG